MAIHIVRLGSPRGADEGLRIGTVRRPPRGVKKEHFASQDWYDVWFPTLSPSPELVAAGLGAEDEAAWRDFAKCFRREMQEPAAARALDLFAALSHHTSVAIGCYCENEARCHRGILRELLEDRGAELA